MVLLGTFAVLAVVGFSINTLTLFALVLAIGLLVDDAIVVVENVERLMDENPDMSPRDATVQSMQEIQVALVAIALVVAAVELVWPGRDKRPKEPTRSPFAAFVVLLARQWGAAARFLLFALAAATALPAYVALGGAAGAGVALAGGWALGEELDALPLRAFRLVMAGIVLLAGLLIGLGVRGII